MNTDCIIYENKYCRIINRDTIYVVQSKAGKYNDQYFQTAEAAYRCIGLNMYGCHTGKK